MEASNKILLVCHKLAYGQNTRPPEAREVYSQHLSMLKIFQVPGSSPCTSGEGIRKRFAVAAAARVTSAGPDVLVGSVRGSRYDSVRGLLLLETRGVSVAGVVIRVQQ